MRKVKIKTWDEMAINSNGVDAYAIDLKNGESFTQNMENLLPQDRIIEINESMHWKGGATLYNYIITYEMIKEDVPDSPTPMRSDVREGDRMWSVLTGWGTIHVDGREDNVFPLAHTPDNEDCNTTYYTIDKTYISIGEQALFFARPNITQKMIEVPETRKVVLTKKEIADKFGISLESLEIEG